MDLEDIQNLVIDGAALEVRPILFSGGVKPMKAIIIEEVRFAEIAEKLKLEAEKLKIQRSQFSDKTIPQDVWELAVSEVFSSLNYYFVQWAQSQGASCIR